VLTASVRSLEHFARAIELGSDIITAPLKVIKEWADAGLPTGISNFPASAKASAGRQFPISNLKPITYQQISLDKPWQEYNIRHELTDKGIEKFAADWNNLIL